MGYDTHPQGVAGEKNHLSTHNNTIAALHNDLKAALDAAADGDLLGADANSEVKTIDSGTYRKDDTALWIPAHEMSPDSGSPSTEAPGSFESGALIWRLDGAAAESIIMEKFVPASWSTVNVSLYWTQRGTGSGDVVVRIGWNQIADGEDLSSGGTLGSEFTLTAPGNRIQKISDLDQGISITGGEPLHLGVQRLGSDNRSADTLTDDMGVRGFLIEKAS